MSQQLSHFERMNNIRETLDRQFIKAAELEQQNKEEQAVEEYFLCLGMVKKIIESDLFNYERDKVDFQQLLVTYDLPCSLRMCKILSSHQVFDKVLPLAQRVLSIDPSNREAQAYLKRARDEQEKNDEWSKLKNAQDMNSFFKEYSES